MSHSEPNPVDSELEPAGTAASEALQPPAGDSDDEFLQGLGRQVREIRDRRGMTRKAVARDASVSERHLAHLESGDGNISIVLLRRIAGALGASLTDLLTPPAEDSVEKRLIRRFLERLPPARLEEVVFKLRREFGHEEAMRRRRIALVGLRGAGKSTLGNLLAREKGVAFVELDREIERETGMPGREIFDLYGQSGYRRIERRVLERVLSNHERAVLSVGGGIVAETDTYETLLAHCYAIWIKARPEEHMARVMAQGDLRPMAGNDEAMADLQRILNARESLYAKADAVLDTSGESVEASFDRLQQIVSR